MRWPAAFPFVACIGALLVTGNPLAVVRQDDSVPDPTPVFKAKCVSCHGASFPAAGLDLTKSLAEIAKDKHVIAGRPHGSSLFKAVDSGDMPKGGSKLSPAELVSIRDWIQSLRTDPRPLFQAKCVSCHHGDGAAAGLDLSGDLHQLAMLKQADVGDGTATSATLYRRIADGTMPKGGPKLTEAEMLLVQDWIEGLRPNPKPLFQAKCVSCHSGASAARGLDLSVDLGALANATAVHKGLPAKSALYLRTADGSMPRGGKPLTDSEVGVIWDWILAQQPPKTAENRS